MVIFHQMLGEGGWEVYSYPWIGMHIKYEPLSWPRTLTKVWVGGGGGGQKAFKIFPLVQILDLDLKMGPS